MATKRQYTRTLLTVRQLKERNAKTGSNNTPGKGKTCGTTTPILKTVCKRNRSYKMREYDSAIGVLSRRAHL